MKATIVQGPCKHASTFSNIDYNAAHVDGGIHFTGDNAKDQLVVIKHSYQDG